MKNYLILGLLAVFLFSVSAALSLWLNQSKQVEPTAEKDKKEEKEKAAAKGPKEVVDKPPILPKPEDATGGLDSGRFFKDREARLQYRKDQVELVLSDLNAQREATDVTLSKVLAEAKNLGAETAKLDALAKDLKDKQLVVDADDKKSIEQLARVYDAMAPESAAALLKEMVEKGKLDTAAKIFAQMKERNTARVLDAMNDPALASQIISRVEKLRPTPPAKGP